MGRTDEDIGVIKDLPDALFRLIAMKRYPGDRFKGLPVIAPTLPPHDIQRCIDEASRPSAADVARRLELLG